MQELETENLKNYILTFEEMAEQAAKNAVLDPIKQEIRLHGLYSSAPTDWKDIKGDAAKNIQTKLGFTGKDLDGILGKKSIAAIEAWNKDHPKDQITQPNDLADMLGRIDALEYDFGGQKKKFNPAELDELRKLVYGGEDPTAANRENWNNWARGQAQSEAENRLAWQNVLRRSKKPGYTHSTEDKAVAKKNNFYWDKKIQDYVKIGGTK